MSDSVDMTNRSCNDRPARLIALSVLVVILILAVPQFLRMPLTNDPVYYDLQAKNVLNDGVLYRDMVEPNLPGVVWLHIAVRSLLGDSSEAIRAADLLIFAGSVLVLCGAIIRTGGRASTALCAACGMFWCYLSLAEWSQVQRDPWLLLPAGIAMWLRERQIGRMRRAESTVSLFLFGLLEGIVWGMGVWIKPHIMIPAAIVWFLSAWLARRVTRSLVDLAGLVLGGLIVGAIGIMWLVRTGAWPYFWDTLTVLNPTYVAGVRREWKLSFFLGMCGRFLPWVLLYLPIIPLTLTWLNQSLRNASQVKGDRPTECTNDERRALWSALFLGWMLQAMFLQILFDYVHVPCLILAIALFAMWYAKQPAAVLRWTSFGLAVAALIMSPLAWPHRLTLWPRCLSEASGPELRNQLRRIADPDWEDLEQVARFLQEQNVATGDVVCYNNHLIHLYPRLGIQPKVRFVYQATWQLYLKSHIQEIQQDLLEHRPRYIISDLHAAGLSDAIARADGPRGPLSLPAEFPAEGRRLFPWRYPIVFRAGAYLVHEFPSQNAKPSVK